MGRNGLISIEADISNVGQGDATATTVRLYQSADVVITASDSELWKAAVPALRAGETHYQWTRQVPEEVAERYNYAAGEERYWQPIVVSGPSSLGTVFYGLCVDPVPGEPEPPPHWTFGSNCKVLPVTTDSRPPYWTRWHPLIFIGSDPSACTDLGYVGEDGITISHFAQSPRSVYLYEARYADQQTITVMVDQGFAQSRADELAALYARRVGLLPARSVLEELIILVCCSWYDGDTPWHGGSGAITWAVPHIKVAFYLDDLGPDDGCLRVQVALSFLAKPRTPQQIAYLHSRSGWGGLIGAPRALLESGSERRRRMAQGLVDVGLEIR